MAWVVVEVVVVVVVVEGVVANQYVVCSLS